MKGFLEWRSCLGGDRCNNVIMQIDSLVIVDSNHAGCEKIDVEYTVMKRCPKCSRIQIPPSLP